MRADTIIEPVTINGQDIEKMSREELIAAIRAMAPMIAEMQAYASDLLVNLQSLRDADGVQNAVRN